MRLRFALTLLLLVATCGTAWLVYPRWGAGETLEPRTLQLQEEPLPEPFARLLDLHDKRGWIRPADWLGSHEERGQSYAEYRSSRPNRPDATRKHIYVQLIGVTPAGHGLSVGSPLPSPSSGIPSPSVSASWRI